MSWAGLSAAHTSSSTLPEDLKVLKSSALYRWSGLSESDRGGMNEPRLRKKTPANGGDLPPGVEVGHAALELVLSQEQESAGVRYGRSALLLTFVFIIDEQPGTV